MDNELADLFFFLKQGKFFRKIIQVFHSDVFGDRTQTIIILDRGCDAGVFIQFSPNTFEQQLNLGFK